MVETYIALKKAGASAELHIYESGGHGFGVRKTGLPIANWPERMKEWMIRLELL
jgi:endo-1,4-beta-xylanase